MSSIPREMNAIVIRKFGGIDVLEPAHLPVPSVGPGQVLVKVAFASVASWDPFVREGGFAQVFGHAPNFPYIIGSDGSGTIAAVGIGVTQFAVGDQVYSMGMGHYAEYIVLDAQAVSPVPKGLPLDQAGAMPSIALTALVGLAKELQVQSGRTIVISGASGDTGQVAVQLAKLLGARVLAIASGEDGVALARELGADAAIDGKTADIAAAVEQFAPGGVDAALALVGGASLDATIAGVRKGGHVAYPLGVMPEPEPRPDVHLQRYDLTNYNENPAIAQPAMRQLNNLIQSTSFQVKIAQIFPLNQAAAAHQAVSARRVGKILLSTG
ncbi:alcohol dehydrogenase [Ceraceosorus guamensis]|uniref:Alcohol dehydrogenase n=1 Tax=Ceraceosorus guamensis TaxID=1522189 RepID=A0A316VT11_9BASI|nr:alcohol dehydrogenase [Ceraceosorus guamensis]PWN40364.1 alcohol dehydrogenase [Ceraceosorus guamensis]